MSNAGPVHDRRGARRRRLKATAVVVFTVALGVAASACGGDGQLSQAEYERELQEAGRELETAFDGVGSDLADVGTGSASLDDVAENVEAMRERIEQEAEELEGLDPPENAEDAHEELVDGLNELARELGEFETAIGEGDVARVREFISDFEGLDAVERIEQATRELESKGYSVDDGR